MHLSLKNIKNIFGGAFELIGIFKDDISQKDILDVTIPHFWKALELVKKFVESNFTLNLDNEDQEIINWIYSPFLNEFKTNIKVMNGNILNTLASIKSELLERYLEQNYIDHEGKNGEKELGDALLVACKYNIMINTITIWKKISKLNYMVSPLIKGNCIFETAMKGDLEMFKFLEIIFKNFHFQYDKYFQIVTINRKDELMEYLLLKDIKLRRKDIETIIHNLMFKKRDEKIVRKNIIEICLILSQKFPEYIYSIVNKFNCISNELTVEYLKKLLKTESIEDLQSFLAIKLVEYQSKPDPIAFRENY